MSNKIRYTVDPIDIPAVRDVHLTGIFGNFEDVIDNTISEYNGKKSHLAQTSQNFYQWLKTEVDANEFASIQKKYVTPEQVAVGRTAKKAGGDHLKYIDPVHWFRGKMSASLRIDLDKQEPMDILDIGTGCGHFPTIARYFGHTVLGVDMPLHTSVSGQDTHFYNRICDVYGVDKRDLKIEPFTDFEFEKKFDMVTAFMAAFNVMEDRTPYTIEAWKYFFKNLNEKVLNPGGQVYFSLTHGKVTDEVWEFLKSKSEWADDSSLHILFKDIESIYAPEKKNIESKKKSDLSSDRETAKASHLKASELLEKGSIDSAKDIFETMLSNNPEDVLALRSLARIETEADNYSLAIQYWAQVRNLRPDISEVSLRLARLYFAQNSYSEASQAYQDYLQIVPDHAESQKKIEELHSYTENMKGVTQYGNIQHISILGVSYCGSTLLSRLMGNAKGVENVGESHWLTSKKDVGSGTDVDFDQDDKSSLVQCFACSDQCAVFTHEFRKNLQSDPVNWYFKIAQQLNCQTLVSADKNISKLKKLDPTLSLDGVVLFKSPLQAWYSNYRKSSSASSTMTPITDINKYMDAWASSYTNFLDNFPNTGDKVFLSFDEFCKDPDSHMSKLGSILGLKFDESTMYHYGHEQHYFGGNSGVNKKIRSEDSQLQVNELPVIDLPAEHIEAIQNNEQVQRVYERLSQQYKSDFSVVDSVVTDSIQSVLDDIATTQTIVESKRQAYFKAAECPVRHLKNRRKALMKKRDTAEQQAIINTALDTFDWSLYRQIQKDYLSKESLKVHSGFVKYLALDYWLDAKYKIAAKLNLLDHQGGQEANNKSLSILDIGTGPGHFPLVCKLLGHDVCGTDIPLNGVRTLDIPHIYDSLIDMFGVERHTHSIQQFEKMPSFGRKFDLITGLMIKFNVGKAGKPWDVEQWDFFLKDILENQLNENGRMFLKMNMKGRDTSVEYISDEVLQLMEDWGGKIDLKESTVEFRAKQTSFVAAA